MKRFLFTVGRRSTFARKVCLFSSNANTQIFQYQELFDLGEKDETQYKLLTDKFVKTTTINGKSFLEIDTALNCTMGTFEHKEVPLPS